MAVFQGMLSGALQVGSGTPVADTPTWATLEVVAGDSQPALFSLAAPFGRTSRNCCVHARAYDHLGQQCPALQADFRPALYGLALVAAGDSLDTQDQRRDTGDARRFLGWTTERHWLIDGGR